MAEAKLTCPNCGRETTELIPIETGMKLALNSQPTEDDAVSSVGASEVCPICYNELSSQVSRGARLVMEAKAKERNRQMLWKSRVGLVKKARILMEEKAFSEAAVNYEKYIRVLEMSYELKQGELNPEVFGATSRSKEITIIASTYWDLMRIYDTSGAYRDRMRVAAKKLAAFLPYTSIFPDVIKRAQSFVKSAKNSDIVRDFLRDCKASNQRCFIATASFYPYAPEVNQLRHFRDSVLANHYLGRLFISSYYFISPPIASILRHSAPLRAVSRSILRIMCKYLLKISSPS